MKRSLLSLAGLPLALSFLLLCLLMPTSCKKDDSAKPDQKPSVSMSSTQVKAYEICLLQVNNYELTAGQYELQFGNEKIQALKNADNSLSFMAPGGLTTGIYTLNAPFANVNLNVDYTAAAKIADPDATIQLILGNTAADIKDIQDITGNSTIPSEVQKAQADLDKALQAIQALPEDQRQQVAQLMEANSEFITGMQDFMQQFRDDNPFGSAMPQMGGYTGNARGANSEWSKCENAKCKALVVLNMLSEKLQRTRGAALLRKVNEVLSPWLKLAAEAISAKAQIAFSKARELCSFAFDLAYFAPNLTIEKVLDEADKEITSGLRSSQADEMKIYNGIPFTISSKLDFRTLNAGDVNSPVAEVKSAVKALEEAKAFYKNTLGSIFGPFPEYKNRTERKSPAELKFWKLRVTSGNVTVTAPKGSAESFTVSFNSKELAYQPFSFTLSYDDGMEKAEKSFSAKLVAPDISKLLVPGSTWECISAMAPNADYDTVQMLN